MREWVLAFLLALAAGLIVFGVAAFSTGAAFITSGVLLAALAWLLLAEVDAE